MTVLDKMSAGSTEPDSPSESKSAPPSGAPSTPKPRARSPFTLPVGPLLFGTGVLLLALPAGESVLWLAVRLGLTLAILLVVPAVLISRRLHWPEAVGAVERVLLSGAVALLGCMVGGALWNWLGPRIGVEQPLARPWLLGISVSVVLGLWLWRRGAGGEDDTSRPALQPLTGAEQLVVALSLVDVVAAAAGAVRLNNGHGSGTAFFALCVGMVLLALILGRRPHLRQSVVLVGLYAFALALLLALSMRGWYVSGHDIQREFRLAEETAQRGLWTPGQPANAYNACLSITVLPALLAKLSGVPVLWIFKVATQLIFALVPLIVYRIGFLVVGPVLAVFAAAYFSIFPTFIGDMPYLNRQEIAFVFVALFVLVLIRAAQWRQDDGRALSGDRRRWATRWGLVLGAGIVVSHYSTNYVFLGALVVAAAVLFFVRLVRRSAGGPSLRALRPIVLTVPVVVALAVMTVVWTGPVTNSGGQLERTTSAVLDFLRGEGSGTASSDTGYSILSFGEGPTEQERLDSYATAEATTPRSPGLYSMAELEDHPTVAVPEEPMPLTGLGRALDGIGIPVAALVSASRSLAAIYFQGMVLLGCVLLLLRRRRPRPLAPEYLALVCGSILTIGLQIVLPALTVDYGLLRAFQQSLIVFAPVIAYGAHVVLRRLVGRFADVAHLVVVLGLTASLTGAVPQVFGGYPAQLSLDNAGTSYDIYYFQRGEVLGLRWVEERRAAGEADPIATDTFTYSRLQNLAVMDGKEPVDWVANAFPTRLPRDAFVVLGPATVQREVMTVFYTGDLIDFRYPISLLDETKDLVYSNGYVKVYR